MLFLTHKSKHVWQFRDFPNDLVASLRLQKTRSVHLLIGEASLVALPTHKRAE